MPPFRVIALGDSLTYGYPFGKPMSWVERAAQEIKIPILNQGVNGDTLRELLKRLTIDVLDLKPEYCLVMAGTNDVYRSVDVELMQSNFTKLMEILKKNKIKTVVGLPPPVQDEVFEKDLAKFRRWLKKFAKEKFLPVIDFHRAFIDPKKKRVISSYWEDGVHPSSAGYEAMAKTAVKTLNLLLG